MHSLTPTYLRCEYRVNPLGIDVAQPKLSWILESDDRNQHQSAYRVLVADSLDALDQETGTLWDSSRVVADDMGPVYAGVALKSRQRCYWKVRAWDRDGRPSEWSAAAFWTMGLLGEEWQPEWIGYDAPYGAVLQSGHLAIHEANRASEGLLLRTAKILGRRLPWRLRGALKWIIIQVVRRMFRRQLARFRPVLAPCPYVRKEFRSRTPLRATLYASALGLYEMHINGRRVGDDYFTPGWTDYNRRLYYQTYDVTPLIGEGANAIGAILADGWYSGYVGPGGSRCYYGIHPRFAMRLEIDHADGSRTTITTDGTWKAATGPHLEADLLMGETYDARRELTGWTLSGYDDSAWSPVTQAPGISARLQAMSHPPVHKIEELRPVRISCPKPGCYVYDMGRNIAGWARLKVNGPPGTTVTLRFGERLNPDRTIYTANLRRARATDTYVLRGTGYEEWEPRFTFHGFQYVEVTGYPGTPTLESIRGVVAHSAMPRVGWFECSDPMINALYENILWSQRANSVDIPTDCPQRDERLGWLGDVQVFARTATYNLDVAAFLAKWLVDVADAQSAEGAYPDVAPRGPATQDGAPGWADAGIICPWTLYWAYGDRRVIHSHYRGMKAWIESVRRANPGFLRTRGTAANYGDWLAVDGRTPPGVLATAYFAYCAALLAQMASAVGEANDAHEYDELYRSIRQAFTEAYVTADSRVKGETQTCYVLALRFDLLPEALRGAAARYLVDAIERAGGHLSTGFYGTAYLLPVLTRYGALDVAYRVLGNDTYPSWGYWIRHGATSLWERWDGWTPQHGFQDPTMNSFCHCAFGSIGEWLYSAVAGIDTEAPGFKRIVIRPRLGGGLTSARARYDSIHGRIATAWTIGANMFHLDVTIPPNTTATLYLPAGQVDSITEGGSPVRSASDIQVVGIDNGSVILQIGSGQYRFNCDVAGVV